MAPTVPIRAVKRRERKNAPLPWWVLGPGLWPWIRQPAFNHFRPYGAASSRSRARSGISLHRHRSGADLDQLDGLSRSRSGCAISQLRPSAVIRSAPLRAAVVTEHRLDSLPPLAALV